MKRNSLKRTNRKSEKSSRLKNTLARHLTVQLGQVSILPLLQKSSSCSNSNQSRLSQKLREDQQLNGHRPSSLSLDHLDANNHVDDKDFILSQDIFCTPDYITPDGQQISNALDCNKESECPKSPEKSTLKTKRLKKEGFLVNFAGSESPFHKQVTEIASDAFGSEELNIETSSVNGSEKKQNYVSQAAVALRCRVMPPPCIRNPYSKETADTDLDPFGNQRSKSLAAGVYQTDVKEDGFSRYTTDFHEIEQIGYGNFSRVFKVLKRIEGCMYAVKHSIRQLYQDTERRRALMEVQALAALGSHENIVGYYTSWFENEKLYIQMELCDCSLSIQRSSKLLSEGEILDVMYQIAKALQFIHERGVAHLDVKPDNIYVKNGVYKLGDFGCATLIDGSLPIEEGDARYMPQEILNDKYEHLEKVDIFSLGAAIYELIKRTPLPKSGPQFLNLREGKISLLPGHSMQFQNLLKVMVDPDPMRRPSAKELLENPIFERVHRT